MAAFAASRWQKWRQLDRRSQGLFITSLILLKTADMLLRFSLFQDLYGRVVRFVPLHEPVSTEVALARAPRTVEIVELAANRRVANATCLRRSLVLWYLLRREGIDSDLRLGVRKKGGMVFGNAWVEIDGTVINDDADDVRQYTLIDLQKRS
jgi:type IV secretory pathway component VirB8